MYFGRCQAFDGNNRRQETEKQELSSGLRVVLEEQTSTDEGRSQRFILMNLNNLRLMKALLHPQDTLGILVPLRVLFYSLRVRFQLYNCFYLQQYISNKTGYTPLPFKTGVSPLKAQNVPKAKTKPAKQTPLHNKSVISSIIAEKAKFSQEVKLEKHSAKIKPKLKAEVKVKNWEDDENDTMAPESIPHEELSVQDSVKINPSNKDVNTSERIDLSYKFTI